MVKKKQAPKALFSVKADFMASLENVAQQGNMLLIALETALQHNSVQSNVADLLKERAAAFRAALVEPLELE
jgi:hypothetical protein